MIEEEEDEDNADWEELMIKFKAVAIKELKRARVSLKEMGKWDAYISATEDGRLMRVDDEQ